MRKIVERTDRIGAISRTDRTIIDTTPWYWRAAIAGALIEVCGALFLMGYILALAVARRHGWM
jgi:energy-converting hydrogenase Eha subunit C